MGIGNTVRFLRLSAGLKQSELADRLEVTSNYISLIENNKREPSLSFLRDLSDVLGVPMGLLFLETNSDLDKISTEERILLLRIRDLMLQIEQIRLQNHRQVSYGT